jgi:hypothetical protein
MLEDVLKQVYVDLGTALRWGWDERFCTALMVLQGDEAAKLLVQVTDVFDEVWEESSVAQASEDVGHMVTYLSGLRGEQRLHTKILDDSTILFAAIWPWVGKSHISYRVGVFRAYATPDVSTQAQTILKTIFTTPDA